MELSLAQRRERLLGKPDATIAVSVIREALHLNFPHHLPAVNLKLRPILSNRQHRHFLRRHSQSLATFAGYHFIG